MFAGKFEIRLPTFPIWIIGNTKLQQARYEIVFYDGEKSRKSRTEGLPLISLLSESFGTFRGNFQLVMA